MIKSFIVGVLVSLCTCALRINHGAFNESLRILYSSCCSFLWLVLLVPDQTGDAYVIIGLINVLYYSVVVSGLSGVFLFMRKYSLNKRIYALVTY